MLLFDYMELLLRWFLLLLLLLYNLYVNVKIIFARIEIESSLALSLYLLFIRSNVYQKRTQKMVI